MAEQIRLLPCPFCAGPPIPIITRSITLGGGVFPAHEVGENGLDVTAYVFCHECGANTELVDDRIYDLEEAEKLKAQAVALWNTRDARHIDLYCSGEKDGLNLYPRGTQKSHASPMK